MSLYDDSSPTLKNSKPPAPPHDNPKPVVKIIYKKRHIEGDHEEHIDERWLVSYSDMMTLLFGLFVMLYAMQDPEATKQMQESIKQNFAQESVDENRPPPPNPAELQKQLTELTAQLELQKMKIQEAEDLKLKVAILENDAKKNKDDLEKQIQENAKTLAELKKLDSENKEKTRSIASIETEKKSASELEKDKKKLEESLKLNKDNLDAKILEVKNKDEELLKLKEELATKAALIQKLDKPKVDKKDFEKEYIAAVEKEKVLDIKNKDLETKIRAIEQKGSFLAIVLNWTTNEHDLDLVVKDPNGKKFTFKTKEYPNYPGKMVLDSRRGPGAEIWQADKVIAGTYEAEITFYNQYGNPVPAEAKLVIFSTRGNVEVPDIKLDLAKNPKRSILFEISQLGEIKLK